MTSGTDFSRAIRGGRRQGSRTVVAHYAHHPDDAEPPRVGFAVSKAVGNSVVRHRVTRQLRHLMRSRVANLPDGSLVVLRATPAAAGADSADLAADLDRAIRRAQRSFGTQRTRPNTGTQR